MNTYKIRGAYITTVNNVKGVRFSLWAPNALKVSVIGNFNDWDKSKNPMELNNLSGIWELFIPGTGEGVLYRYHILSKYYEHKAEKLDPYAFFTQKGGWFTLV